MDYVQEEALVSVEICGNHWNLPKNSSTTSLFYDLDDLRYFPASANSEKYK